MKLSIRIILMAAGGLLLGRMLGRPALGVMIGAILGALIPVERYLKNSASFFFMSLLLLVILLPPVLGLIGLFLLVPLLISMNIFSPGKAGRKRTDWFDMFGNTDPNQSMVKLLAGLVQASSTNNDRQKQRIKQYITQSAPGLNAQFLWQTFQESLNETIDLEETVKEFRQVASSRQQRFLIQVMVEIASDGDTLDEDQKDYLRQVAKYCGIDEDVIESLFNVSSGRRRESRHNRRRTGTTGGRRGRSSSRQRGVGNVRKAYDTLDLDPSASRDEVKEAYQEKVKKFHPDKHRDKDEQKREEVEQKMAEINQAYQTIKNQW